MGEIQTISLRVPDEVRAEAKRLGEVLGMSEHAFMIEAIKAAVQLIRSRKDPRVPRFISIIWHAEEYDECPIVFKMEARKLRAISLKETLLPPAGSNRKHLAAKL